MTISAPSRRAHSLNCSTAAARNVSPAPSTTRLPCEVKYFVSFAIDVVLPEPFTPATMMTVGPSAAMSQRRGILRHQFLQLPPDDVEHFGHVDHAGAKLGADLIDDLFGGGGPHVGLDQDGSQLFEKLVVDQPAFFFEQVADVGEEQLVGFFQPLLQSPKTPIDFAGSAGCSPVLGAALRIRRCSRA